MKNKYLMKFMCISLVSALVLSGPAAVYGSSDIGSEVLSSETGEDLTEPSPEPTEPPETSVTPDPEPTEPPETPEPTEPPETSVTPDPEPTPTLPPLEPEEPVLVPDDEDEGLVEMADVDNVISRIALLTNVTLDMADLVAEIRMDYEQLSSAEKEMVTNLYVLEAAERKIQALQAEQEKQEEQDADTQEDLTGDSFGQGELLEEKDSSTTGTYRAGSTSSVLNLHAGKEFYLDSLAENYDIEFAEDFSEVMDEIETEYKEDNKLVDECDKREDHLTSSWDSLLVRNWQDILAVYIYEQSKLTDEEKEEKAKEAQAKEAETQDKETEAGDAKTEGEEADAAKEHAAYVLDESAKEDLARIFKELNPVVRDKKNITKVSYGNYNINYYIKKHKVSKEDRKILKKYVETDCKLLCATVTAAKGFVRQSVGDEVSEERVNVITVAYSLVGKVGYFWGGKSTYLGEDPDWGEAAVVSAAGSRSSGTTKAFGLDCSGFVTWAVINGYWDQAMQSEVGDGTSAQWENALSVDEEDAQPGDFVFQNGPESGSDNHVGIICGQTDAGDWIAVHCSSSKNGVTVGVAYSASFRYIRQPAFYPTEEELKAIEEEKNSLDGAGLKTQTTVKTLQTLSDGDDEEESYLKSGKKVKTILDASDILVEE